MNVQTRTCRQWNGRQPAIRFGVLVAVGLLLGACSYVPDWANPLAWYDRTFDSSGDSQPAAAAAAPPSAGADQPFPKLSSVPDQPPTATSKAERKQIAQGLVADAARARYTDEETDTQVAATTPQPTPSPPPVVVQAPATVVAQAPPAPPPAAVPSRTTPVSPSVSVQPATPMPVPSIVQRRPAARVAAAPQPVTPMPVPSIVQRRPAAPQPVPSIVQRRPASPAVAAPQTVPAPVASAPAQGQRQLASVADVFAEKMAASASTVTTAPAHTGFGPSTAQPLSNLPKSVPAIVRDTYNESVGGAVAGSTAVVIAPAVGQVAREPVVIRFRHGSANLSAADRRRLRSISEAFKAQGGVVRVVGHASSRTRDMPVLRHKLANFNVSHDRAVRVASELVRQGVTRNAILVEARSDADPAFIESMPAGEAGNRRTEVYLES